MSHVSEVLVEVQVVTDNKLVRHLEGHVIGSVSVTLWKKVIDQDSCDGLSCRPNSIYKKQTVKTFNN